MPKNITKKKEKYETQTKTHRDNISKTYQKHTKHILPETRKNMQKII